MDRRVTPPRRATSPTFGPPPPFKQALKKNFFLFLTGQNSKYCKETVKRRTANVLTVKQLTICLGWLLRKTILEGFLPGNLGISCYKKLGRGARCFKGENGPLTAKKCPH